MGIYLNYCSRIKLGRETPANIIHPLARRMTVLQKATLSAFAKFKEEAPFSPRYTEGCEVPFYFATAFGEVSALQAIYQGVIAEDFPLSPRDFQHSVHNAAIGYAGIVYKIINPCVVASAGFLSAAKTLHYLGRRIETGLDHNILLIHANEMDDPSGETSAEAEVLALSQTPLTAKSVSLRSQYFHENADWSAVVPKGCALLKEGDGRLPWLTPDLKFPQGVAMVSTHGEAVYFNTN